MGSRQYTSHLRLITIEFHDFAPSWHQRLRNHFQVNRQELAACSTSASASQGIQNVGNHYAPSPTCESLYGATAGKLRPTFPAVSVPRLTICTSSNPSRYNWLRILDTISFFAEQQIVVTPETIYR
jgi:hypothetical protein